MNALCIFPNEIWDDVLSYVTKRDLKNLRLAGKWHPANLASSRLFTTARIAARRRTIDAVSGLANHSVLRHYVKVLFLDSSYLDPEIRGEPSGLDWSKCDEVVHENKQIALAFAEQEYIQAYNLRPALEHACKSFPSVETIVSADMPCNLCIPAVVLNSEPSSILEWNYQDDPVTLRPLAGKYQKQVSPCCLAGLCGRQHLSFYRRQFGGLTTLLQAVDDHPLEFLSELSLGSNFTAPYASGIPFFFFDQSAKTFGPLLNIISALRKLEITICFPSLQRATGLYVNAGQSTASLGSAYIGLRRMLESAKGLRELYLSGETNVASLSLSHLWPDQTLGSLQILHLISTEASYNDLSTLIWCNKSTLRSVRLDDFNLLTNGWPEICKFIQTCAPDLNVIYGFTWYQGVTQPITWSPNDPEEVDIEDVDWDGGDPEDGSFSDGEDFVHTRKIVGYRQKTEHPGSAQTYEGEYEDVIEVSKDLKTESDSESLEYDSDEQMSDFA